MECFIWFSDRVIFLCHLHPGIYLVTRFLLQLQHTEQVLVHCQLHQIFVKCTNDWGQRKSHTGAVKDLWRPENTIGLESYKSRLEDHNTETREGNFYLSDIGVRQIFSLDKKTDKISAEYKDVSALFPIVSEGKLKISILTLSNCIFSPVMPSQTSV